MAAAEYHARRSLAPGHVAGAMYVVEFSALAITRKPQDKVRVQETLSGRTERIHYGTIVVWDVQIEPVRMTDAALLREFLESTRDGQVFIFDPYGSAHHVHTTIQVRREDNGYGEERVMVMGTGGDEDYVRFSFQLRQEGL